MVPKSVSGIYSQEYVGKSRRLICLKILAANNRFSSSFIPLILGRVWWHYISIPCMVVLHPSVSWTCRDVSWIPWFLLFDLSIVSTIFFFVFYLLFFLVYVPSILDMFDLFLLWSLTHSVYRSFYMSTFQKCLFFCGMPFLVPMIRTPTWQWRRLMC